jgi:tetratricopeptide (TPR) repeat protein
MVSPRALKWRLETRPWGWRQRLLLAVLAVMVYSPVLRGGFMIDDPFLIQGNPHIRSWSVAEVKNDFTAGIYPKGGSPYYRPVLMMLLRAQYSLWGERPFGYHLTALLFHAANTVLTAELVLALGFSALAALLTGLLFAAHPMIVGEIMPAAASAIMALTAILATVLLVARPSLAAYAGGLLCFVIALFTKETCLVIPFLSALFLYATRRRAKDYGRLVPMVSLWFPYLWLKSASTGLAPGIPAGLILQFYTKAFPRIAFFYARLVLFPWNLLFWRAVPSLSPLWPLYGLAMAGIPMYLAFKKERRAVFAYGWFVILLAPCMLGVLLHNNMGDQWVYPSMIGLLFPLGAWAARHWNSSNRPRQRITQTLFSLAILASALLVPWNVANRGSDEKNFEWTIRFFPQADFAKRRLVALLIKERRLDDAQFYLERFHRETPEDAPYANDLALVYWHQGHAPQAIALLKETLADHPDVRFLRDNLDLIQKAAAEPLLGMGTVAGSAPEVS